ncbi:MAG: transporter substrate-binding domain-containing protein, partial [Desulfobacteraceae bacterium]|nr:transporter substrate-binding domain-containing protein [Desulfobacteraceae bacterium]
YGIDFYGDNLFTTEQELSEHPERVKKIRRATLKGWRYALENREEIINLILEKYNPQGHSRDHLAYEARETEKLIAPDFIEMGSFKPAHYQNIAKTYARAGFVEKATLDPGFFYQPKTFSQQIQLTTEEQAWLDAHPVIRIGSSSEFEPDLIRKPDGSFTGISPDFYRMLEKRLGIRFEIVDDKWSKILRHVAAKEIDIVDLMNKTTAEEMGLLTIKAPYDFLVTAYARKDRRFEIARDEDIEGLRVAYFKDIVFLQKHFDHLQDRIEVIEADSPLGALKLLLDNKADVMVGFSQDSYFLLKHFIKEIEPVYTFKSLSANSITAIRSDAPLLASILSKAVNSVSHEERNRILSKWSWIPEKKESAVVLSAEEKAWLKENPVIRLGNSVDWPPFGFINDEGVYSGIAADYMQVIEKLLGIQIKPVKLNSWKETVDAASKGEVDLLDAVVPTPQRRKFLTFTKPYVSYPIVLFTHKSVDYIADMSVLNKKRVSVIAGSALHDILRNNHPEIEIVAKENAKDGLLAVEGGEASAFIGNLPTASRVISRAGLINLKVAGETPYRYDLTVGINKNKPLLAGLLQKALDVIPEEKHNAIYQKWMSVTFEQQVDYTRFLQLFFLTIFIFIFILFWSRQHQLTKLRREIASKIEIQKELSNKEVSVSAILNTVLDGIITINVKGIIENFNPAAESLFGYQANEVIGQNIKMLMPSPFSDKHDEYLERYVRTGKSNIIGIRLEREAKHRDGSRLSVEISVSEMWIGEELKFTGVIHDITERKQAEVEKVQLQLELQQSQKMEALGKLTGGIAHEYNNMLGITMGFAELLAAELRGQPKLAKYANEIYRAGERGAILTKKLLTFSRRKKPEADSINLNKLLQKQIHMLEKTLTVRIKLVLHLQENPWPVWLDSGDMEDVILNMSINAMHAIEGNGQLTIQTSNQTINQLDAQSLDLAPGDYALLSFTDTGCGMSKDTKEKIFDPFFTTKGEKGTGLGLSMVYGFVQNSGGAIKVFTEPDHGTQFTLYFPRYPGVSRDQESAEELAAVTFTGNETILIVDDEPALLNLTREILEMHGLAVISADSAKQALNILEHESIDILISDIIMPDMDGYQLAAIVTEKYPDIKIQLASGFPDERNMGMIDESLQKNILPKPFSSRALLQRIQKLLHERNFASPT